MTFVVSTFRETFPEFSDTGRYPDTMINYWSVIATAQVNCNRWKDQTDLGINLYVAHEITLEAQSLASANVGGVPGNQSGPTAQKAVGSTSVQYDTQQAAEKGAGWWNLTVYGKQFFRLSRTFGAGVVQL